MISPLRMPGVPWGYVPFLPDQFSNNNRLAIGVSGSGKTLTFRLLMGAQLPWPRRYSHANTSATSLQTYNGLASNTPKAALRRNVFQSLVYDAKTEHVSRLMAHGFTVGEDLWVFNPLDKRSMVWNIAEDVQDKSEAQDFAKLIASELAPLNTQEGTSKHFQDTAKRVILQVIQVLQEKNGGDWRLRDLIHACSSEPMIRAILALHPEGGRAKAHIRDNNEGSSCFSTIQRYLAQFEIVAASWHAIEEKHGRSRLKSLTEWVSEGEGTVLLLPDGDEYSDTTRPFNAFMFKRLAKLMMSPQEKKKKRQRTIFLDELPTAGRLSALPQVLTKGRDYGLTTTIGIQSIDQMYHTYGQHVAHIILDGCPNRAYLKSVGNTAYWCSKQVGRQWIERPQPSETHSHSSTSGQAETFNDKTRTWVSNNAQNEQQSRQTSLVQQEQDAIMPALFMNMKDIKRTGKVQGVYTHAGGRTWGKAIPLHEILSNVAYEDYDDKERPDDFDKVGPEEQKLKPWGAADLRRLGLPQSLHEHCDGPAGGEEKRRPKFPDRDKPRRRPPDIDF